MEGYRYMTMQTSESVAQVYAPMYVLCMGVNFINTHLSIWCTSLCYTVLNVHKQYTH